METVRLSGLTVGSGVKIMTGLLITAMTASNRCLIRAITPVSFEMSFFFYSHCNLLQVTLSFFVCFCSLISLAGVKQFSCVMLSVRLGV